MPLFTYLPSGRSASAGRLRLALALGVVALIGILAAGCGGASVAAPANSSVGSQAGGAGATSPNGPQYLIKSLDVDLAVKDTRQVATDLEAWVAATDPRSQTAGIDYEQTSSGFYHVSVTFSVQATLYPQIERYLADYAGQHNGKLLSLRETVQDVTNDYIDAQSRLSNLRAEQQRLQRLLAQATSLNDVLAIEQRLSDVEGQIEQTEAHLNALNDQTTFYRVTVALEPLEDPLVSAGSQFDPGGTFVNAAHAALAFAEFLVTVLIWLLVFSVFLIPALAIWLVVRRVRRAREAAREAVTPTTPSLPARPAVPGPPVPVSVPAGPPSGDQPGSPAQPPTAGPSA